ncbi:hypothetical protein HNP48_004499 [Acidovorax soli]|uniref:Uncharacterized protein n=1 Tax=Acidovorax soli TaxID=592050 RepID=A0A7X0PH15_9BURK|nr:hypothetical protein [Acidovorax soli]MBB6561805.1 hypothetical protein [Acidovorax soli]
MTAPQAARPGERGAPALGAGAPLVFHARDYHTGTAAQRAQRRRLGRVVGIVLVMVLAVSLVMAVATLVGATAQPFPWQMLASRSAAAWQRADPLRLVFHALQLLLLLALVLGLALHRRRARLVLDNQSLRYTSGLPVVWRWLDWQLDLGALRSGAVSWQLAGAPVPANPLATLRITWKGGARLGLSPARWYLPGEPETDDDVRPHSMAGLVLWNSAKNLPVVQRMFEALPLVRALRERGVPVPAPDGARSRAGVDRDLMAYPRMKAVVIGFFVGLGAAAALFHAMRHQHYFMAPPVGVWGAVGACTALLVLAWLWPEAKLAHGSASPTASERAGFRTTQLLVAALAAVPAGLCAPSVPLAWAWVTEAPRTVAFAVAPSVQSLPRVVLRAPQGGDVPPLEPRQAIDYWLSLRTGATVELPVRRGLAGLWWQFDSSVLEERLEVFYGRR